MKTIEKLMAEQDEKAKKKWEEFIKIPRYDVAKQIEFFKRLKVY